MEHKKIQLFYKNLFKLASRGSGNETIVNPAAIFTKQMKKGEFDNLSDEEFDILLAETEEESNFWNSVPTQTTWELFQTSLENINLSPKQLNILADILEYAYKNTKDNYVPVPLTAQKMLNINIFEQSVDKPVSGDTTSFTQEYGNDAKLLKSPKNIYLYLNNFVYGQEKAKRAAAMMLWNHSHGRKQNMILAGPTGCGKTEIFRQLKKIYPNIVIYDANSLTSEGCKGNMKVRNLFDGMEKDNAERLIIVLDEADKLFESKATLEGIDPGKIIQNELLKIIEGDKVHFEGDPNHLDLVPPLDLDTSKVSFVFLGSFERMLQIKNAKKKKSLGFLSDISENEKQIDYHVEFFQEDLVQYANIRQEIAGRITEIVQLYPMAEEDFYKILSNPFISPVKNMENIYQKKLILSKDTKVQIAKEAAESHMGVRYMKSKLQTLLDKQLFEDCEKEQYTL